jgi:hypothetical protein
VGVSKEANARIEGMEFALRVAKEKGIEGLEKELAWRRGSKVGSIRLTREEINQADDAMKIRCHDTIMALTLLTLRDEFDFGEKRCKRFLERFDSKTDFLLSGEVTWDDITDTLLEEINTKLDIRFK